MENKQTFKFQINIMFTAKNYPVLSNQPVLEDVKRIVTDALESQYIDLEATVTNF